MDRKCFVAVYAHPDDEMLGLAGTLRKYSDEGVKTALVCATRGEGGEISDPRLAKRETLGQVREEELRITCHFVGVDDVSILDYLDGELVHTDEAHAVGRVVYHVHCLRLQVVVTYDENGRYGQPEHLAIHCFPVRVLHQSRDTNLRTEETARWAVIPRGAVCRCRRGSAVQMGQ